MRAAEIGVHSARRQIHASGCRKHARLVEGALTHACAAFVPVRASHQAICSHVCGVAAGSPFHRGRGCSMRGSQRARARTHAAAAAACPVPPRCRTRPCSRPAPPPSCDPRPLHFYCTGVHPVSCAQLSEGSSLLLHPPGLCSRDSEVGTIHIIRPESLHLLLRIPSCLLVVPRSRARLTAVGIRGT